MVRKLLWAAAGAGSLLAGALVGVQVGAVPPVPPCAAPPATAVGAQAAARGEGLAAIQGNTVVMISGPGTSQGLRDPSGLPGVLRHVTATEGIGTAYVVDRPGPDALVVMARGRTFRLPQPGEVMHPSWSPSGDLAWSSGGAVSVLRSTGGMARFPVPAPGSGVFAPVFTGPHELVAVVSEPRSGAARAEDELNDLWRLDLTTGGWTKLTSFEADADRWTVVRTPVVDHEGTLWFVVVRGVASATEPPAYSLWRLRDGIAEEVRPLPGEMYLAGVLNGSFVWNVFSAESGDWRLFLEQEDGSLADLGCGRVLVDPLAESDPDVVERPVGQPARGSRAPRAASDAGAPVSHLAVLVGDLATREEAAAVAEQIRGGFPGAGPVTVVDHEQAPTAVAPGVWAVTVQIPDGLDPTVALAGFRAALPEFADSSWIVSS